MTDLTPNRQIYFKSRNRTIPYLFPFLGTPTPRPWMNETPLASILLRLPIELPDELLAEIDCATNETRYAAFHYDLRTGRVLRENGMTIKPCASDWMFAFFYLHAADAEWCDKNKIQFLADRHWLIYDYRYRRSFVADRRTAMKCIEEQALSKSAFLIRVALAKPSTAIARPIVWLQSDERAKTKRQNGWGVFLRSGFIITWQKPKNAFAAMNRSRQG